MSVAMATKINNKTTESAASMLVSSYHFFGLWRQNPRI